jgi:large subunit ribosomal protein L28
MPRECFVTGAKTMFGHNVSHSNIKTAKTFKTNIHTKTFHSDVLGKYFTLHISSRGLRTIYKHGTIDNFLATTKAVNLTPEALKLKRRIVKILAVKKASSN